MFLMFWAFGTDRPLKALTTYFALNHLGPGDAYTADGSNENDDYMMSLSDSIACHACGEEGK